MMINQKNVTINVAHCSNISEAECNEDGLHRSSLHNDNPHDGPLNSSDGSSTVHFQPLLSYESSFSSGAMSWFQTMQSISGKDQKWASEKF